MKLSIVFEIGPRSSKLLNEIFIARDDLEAESYDFPGVDETIVKISIFPKKYMEKTNGKFKFEKEINVNKIDGANEHLSNVMNVELNVAEENALKLHKEGELVHMIKEIVINYIEYIKQHKSVQI